jgi:FtsP/CotA-like multicopper oxidase with cupredoxin domain
LEWHTCQEAIMIRSSLLVSAVFLVLISGIASAAEINVEMTARPVSWSVGPGSFIDAWTYDGSVPGPVIRVASGDRVRVTLKNELVEATSIHWHGITLPDDQRDAVARPEESITYSFVAPSPGTYWYHAATRPALQVSLGLYGVLIVEPAERDYAVDRTLIIGDLIGAFMTGMPNGGAVGYGAIAGGMGPGTGGGMHPGSGGGMGPTIGWSGGTHISGDMAGTFVLVNGQSSSALPDVQVPGDQRVLLRIVNTGNVAHILHSDGPPFEVVSVEGSNLDRPARRHTVTIHPGESVDAIVSVPVNGSWSIECHDFMHIADGGPGVRIRMRAK